MIKEFHVSKNLFSSVWEQGSINSDSGQNTPSNTIIRTAEYIEIKTNTIYSMTRSIGGDENCYIAIRLYDENKNYIGYGTSQTVQLISGRSEANPMRADVNFCCFKIWNSTNAKYMRIQDTTNNLATLFMLVEGEYTAQTMPDYEPYGNTWNTKSYAKSIAGAQTYTKFPIVLRTTEQSIPIWSMDGNTETSGTASPQNPIAIEGVGEKTENLYNPFTVVKGRLDSGEVTGSTVVTIDNTTINAITFTVTSQYRGVVTDFITIPNDVTRLMFSFSKSGVNVGAKAVFYQTDKTWISDVDGSTISTTIGFTPPTNSAYMRLVITAQAIGTAIISNMMLSYGWEVKEFVPFGYKIPLSSNGTALSPMYLSEQLMKIGDTADSLVSDGTVSYTIRKYVLTGNENIEVLSSGQAPIRISGLYFRRPAYTACTWLCTHYPCVPNSASWGSYDYCLTVSTQDSDSQMRIRDINYNSGTASDFKAYLAAQYAAGTPVTIWVVLSTRTEQVTAPSIPTTSGLNTIDVNTTLKPSEMSLTYDGYKICKEQKYQNNAWT